MNTTKIHNIIMILGIVATGVASIISAIMAGGFNLGSLGATILSVAIFLEHISAGNTPTNQLTGKI